MIIQLLSHVSCVLDKQARQFGHSLAVWQRASLVVWRRPGSQAAGEACQTQGRGGVLLKVKKFKKVKKVERCFMCFTGLLQ